MAERLSRRQVPPVRVFRLVEGSLVMLFVWEAARAVFAVLLHLTHSALTTGEVSVTLVNGHLLLVGALAVAWFAPRPRSALPETLSVSAILVAIARVPVSLDLPPVRLYAGLIVLALGGVYLASLLRANTQSWLAVVVVGLVLDQALRAMGNTFDPTLHSIWVWPQIALSVGLAGISRVARGQARHESYEPAFLTVWGGLALGGFLALEMIVLGSPGVIARWSGLPYSGLAPWTMLASTLPLVPGVQAMMARALGIFDERMRSWVWLSILLLVLVVGHRLSGVGAASALLAAQFMATLMVWWIPETPDPLEVEQVGPSLTVGLLVFAGLIYGYSLTFEHAHGIAALRGQSLPIVLIAGGLLGIPRIFWRETDPWLTQSTIPKGVSLVFVIPMVALGLIFGGLGAEPSPLPPGQTLRVATYNVNAGFDEGGVFRPELLARTIETSRADVVVLQEIDTGRPMSYGVDQVVYLSRRLGMWAAYQPMAEQVQGVAILSRWPIVSSNGRLLSGGANQRAVIRALVTDAARGRGVIVFGAQLAPGDEETRLRQLVELLGFIGDTSPAVLGVDLSSPPEDTVYQQLVAGLFVDPETALGIEQGYTVPADLPQVRHDYVLVNGLAPLASQQVNSTASDHRLVVVEMGWP